MQKSIKITKKILTILIALNSIVGRKTENGLPVLNVANSYKEYLTAITAIMAVIFLLNLFIKNILEKILNI